MILFKRVRSLFRMFYPWTFRRSQKAGLRYYEILQKPDLHYFLLLVPFLLVLFVGMPITLLPLGLTTLLNVDFPSVNRFLGGGIMILLGAIPVILLTMFFSTTIGKDKDIDEKILDMEMAFTTVFTIGSGMIELTNTPAAKSLPISAITQITIRDNEIQDQHEIAGKKYPPDPGGHRRKFNRFDPDMYGAGDSVLFNFFMPKVYTVDVETADSVLRLSNSLRRRQAIQLATTIAKDMGLKLAKPRPRNFLLYETAYDVVR